MSTVTTNLNNWTGEEATIEYSIDYAEAVTVSFKFFDYTWSLNIVDLEDQGTAIEVNSDSWSDTLTTLYSETGEADWVKQAVRWIANNV